MYVQIFFQHSQLVPIFYFLVIFKTSNPFNREKDTLGTSPLVFSDMCSKFQAFGPKKTNGNMKVFDASSLWLACAPFPQKMGERGKHCNVSKSVFFHGFLGPEGHRREAKTHMC